MWSCNLLKTSGTKLILGYFRCQNLMNACRNGTRVEMARVSKWHLIASSITPNSFINPSLCEACFSDILSNACLWLLPCATNVFFGRLIRNTERVSPRITTLFSPSFRFRADWTRQQRSTQSVDASSKKWIFITRIRSKIITYKQ